MTDRADDLLGDFLVACTEMEIDANAYQAAINAIHQREAEVREECAGVCDAVIEHYSKDHTIYGAGALACAKDCANAIRKIGEKK